MQNVLFFYFQPFMGPRYPGGPRGPVRMPNDFNVSVVFKCGYQLSPHKCYTKLTFQAMIIQKAHIYAKPSQSQFQACPGIRIYHHGYVWWEDRFLNGFCTKFPFETKIKEQNPELQFTEGRSSGRKKWSHWKGLTRGTGWRISSRSPGVSERTKNTDSPGFACRGFGHFRFAGQCSALQAKKIRYETTTTSGMFVNEARGCQLCLMAGNHETVAQIITFLIQAFRTYLVAVSHLFWNYLRTSCEVRCVSCTASCDNKR